MRITFLPILSLFCLTALSGCSTKTDFYATGGSRADGTVDMAYNFKPFETPIIDRKQALGIAQSKCQVWGYGDAELFGGQSQICSERNGFGKCIAGQVVEKYQCIGNLDNPGSVVQAPARASALPVSRIQGPSGVMSKAEWQQQQIQQLMNTPLSYEEYQKRYQQIMAQ